MLRCLACCPRAGRDWRRSVRLAARRDARRTGGQQQEGGWGEAEGGAGEGVGASTAEGEDEDEDEDEGEGEDEEESEDEGKGEGEKGAVGGDARASSSASASAASAARKRGRKLVREVELLDALDGCAGGGTGGGAGGGAGGALGAADFEQACARVEDFLRTRLGASREAACSPRAHNPFSGEPAARRPAELVALVALGGVRGVAEWQQEAAAWVSEVLLPEAAVGV